MSISDEHALGIDIGGTNTKSVLIDATGNILYKKTENTPGDLKAFSKLYRTLLAVAKEKRIHVNCIGLSVAGMVDYQQQRLLNCPALAWSHEDFNQHLSAADTPLFHLDNDVNCAALGEQFLLQEKRVNNIVYLALGSGIGCAIIINGQLYRGLNNCAGEIGYWLTKKDGQQDWRQPKNALGQLDLKLGNHGFKMKYDVDTKTACEQAQLNKQPYVTMIQDYLLELSVTIANIVSLLAPEKVILSGGTLLSINQYLKQIQHNITCYTPLTTQLHSALDPIYNAAIGAGREALINENSTMQKSFASSEHRCPTIN